MPLYPNKVIPITLRELATLTAADGKDVLTLPISCTIFRVHMYLGYLGSGAGSGTTVTVYYTKPTYGVSTTGDLWTCGVGVGTIAYGAAAKYISWAASSCLLTRLEAGGTLSLNVDTIATAPAQLEVTLFVYPAAD